MSLPDAAISGRPFIYGDVYNDNDGDGLRCACDYCGPTHMSHTHTHTHTHTHRHTHTHAHTHTQHTTHITQCLCHVWAVYKVVVYVAALIM